MIYRRRGSSGRGVAFITGLIGAMALLQPAAWAQPESDPAETPEESAAGAEAGSDSQRADPQRIRRLRIRGIILTVVGLSMTCGGATMSAFGFDEQDERGDESLRPLSIVFLGIGLALAGVGISDLVTSYLDDDRDEDETSSFRLHYSSALAWTPRPLRPLAPVPGRRDRRMLSAFARSSESSNRW